MEGTKPTSKKKANQTKKKKVKYYKYTFSVSLKEKAIIEKFCKKQHFIPAMLFKTAIREYMFEYMRLNGGEEVLENQLTLFEEMSVIKKNKETFSENSSRQSEIIFYESEGNNI